MRLKTLALSGGWPKFSSSGLGKRGQRAPYELRLPQPDDHGKKELPAARADVILPPRDNPFSLPAPHTRDGPVEGTERSHFWL